MGQDKYAAVFNPPSHNYAEVIYPLVAQMRAEDPLYRTEYPVPAWLVTRYEDVSCLANSRALTPTFDHQVTFERLSEREQVELAPLRDCLRHWFIYAPPGRHRAMQRIFRRYFTTRAVDALRPRVQALVEHLLHQVDPSQPSDFIEHLAYPLPAAVIAEILGVPGADHTRFVAWSRLMLKAFKPYDYTGFRQAQDGFVNMMDYCEERLKKTPLGTDTLLQVMAQAVADGEMSHGEAVANTAMMLFAGHETTATMIGSCVQYTAEFVQQWAQVKGNPARVNDFITEALRLRGTPVAAWKKRYVLEEFDYRGQRFRRGDLVYLSYLSANRDPAVFAEPDVFNIDRPNDRRHLTFGSGSHYCLGAGLAMLEIEVVMTTLLRRFPDMRVDLEHATFDLVPVRLPRLTHLPLLLQP